MANPIRISEAASLALHTAALLAAYPAELFSVGKVAGMLGVSEAHLSKVLQRLAHAGLVTSVRGPHGGFAMAPELAGTTLLTVYEAIEGPLALNLCQQSPSGCDSKDACLVQPVWRQLQEQIRQVLSSHTLDQFVGNPTPT